MNQIIQLFKLTIHKILKYCGLKLVNNSAPVKAEDVGLISKNKSGAIDICCDSSISARYISYLITNNTVLVGVTAENGRGNPINSYGPDGNHPFVFSATIAKDKKESIAKHCIYDILKQYYAKVNPLTAGDLAGVSSNSKLYDYPSWALVMPWDIHLPEYQLNKITRIVRMENSKINRNASINNGWAWTGPAGEIKCDVEAIRLINILNSINKHGYKRQDGRDGDIRAILLVNESNKWIWQSTGGQHRAAVLCAIGYEHIPVRIHRVIRREEVRFWPNVVNGLYSVEDARQVFDNIFQGNFAHVTSRWDDYLKSYRSSLPNESTHENA